MAKAKAAKKVFKSPIGKAAILSWWFLLWRQVQLPNLVLAQLQPKVLVLKEGMNPTWEDES